MWLSITFFTLLTLFIFIALILILLVLIQKGRGGGLASAFGGMGGNTAFGSKTGDVLTWTTAIVFGVFLALAILLNWTAAARHNARTGLARANATAADTAAGAPASENPLLPAVESPSTAPTTNPLSGTATPLLPATPTPAPTTPAPITPPAANPTPTNPPGGAPPTTNSPTTPAPSPTGGNP